MILDAESTHLLCDNFSFTIGPRFNYNKLASLCIGYALDSHAFATIDLYEFQSLEV